LLELEDHMVILPKISGVQKQNFLGKMTEECWMSFKSDPVR